MSHRLTATAALLAASFTASLFAQTAQQKQQDKQLRINQIQVIGSHNSYHTGFAPSERTYLEQKNPRALRALDYSHKPLADQLSGGVRQLEIDVYADAKGGRYAHPRIVEAVAAAGLPADPDFDPEHQLDKPGFKVLHVLDIDQRSSCHTFVLCLQQVRTWSRQHPNHLPVFILVETKEGEKPTVPGGVTPEPFTPEVFDALDAEIRTVFHANEMIVPDQVRGKYPTLEAAVLAGNWPTLAAARGKVVFLMDQRKVAPVYAQGHPSLRDRVIFTNSAPGTPETAFIEENNGSKQEIDELVKKGYLVRTRTDEGTEQARTNDTTRRDLALSTGAQFISTDYPASEPSSWTGFKVELPNGLVARCNPVNKPATCNDGLLAAPSDAIK